MSHRMMERQSNMEKQALLSAQTEEQAYSEHEATLSELQQNVFKAQRAYMRAWSRTTSGKWHARIMFGVTGLLILFMVFGGVIIAQDSWDDDVYKSPRVPLEAHIMSKCPDARDCLRDMILPAMQNVSHKVDFKLSYIGTVTDHDEGVICKHGQEECLGNILELCAAHLYPDPKIYLGFAMCMSRDYDDIPKKELVKDCTLEHGMSFQKLDDCAVADDGSLSLDMLRSSMKRSAAAGVTKSCTVRLDGVVFCVRDGGEWKDCPGGSRPEDLVKAVEKQYANNTAALGW